VAKTAEDVPSKVQLFVLSSGYQGIFFFGVKQLENEMTIHILQVPKLQIHGIIPALPHTSSGMVFN
jgi:hypothetical protein